jgi:hypothetical protein
MTQERVLTLLERCAIFDLFPETQHERVTIHDDYELSVEKHNLLLWVRTIGQNHDYASLTA